MEVKASKLIVTGDQDAWGSPIDGYVKLIVVDDGSVGVEIGTDFNTIRFSEREALQLGEHLADAIEVAVFVNAALEIVGLEAKVALAD